MPSSSPSRRPTSFASSMQVSIVTPAIGTNGMTSVAPMRGCSPVADGHVDQAGGLLGAPERRRRDGLRAPDERQHHPIVGRSACTSSTVTPGHGGCRVADRGDHFGTAALAEVRDALDELHGRSW